MAHSHAETGIAACAPASGGNPSSLPWLAPPDGAEENNASCDSRSEATVLSGAEGGQLGVSNPIHLLTGNKYQRDVDMPALPGFMGLEVTRYYNSRYADPRFTFTGIGRGWRLSYDVHLVISAKAIQVLQADGSRIIFAIDPTNPLACATQRPEQGTLSISDQVGEEIVYRWNRPDGWTLHFNAKGLVRRMVSRTGARINVKWLDAQRIDSVSDDQGRSMDMFYAKTQDGLFALQSIKTPIGILRYSHDQHGNLMRVKWEQNSAAYTNLAAARIQIEPAIQRKKELLYHYEEARFPQHLTGLSVRSDQSQPWLRRNTWEYDAQGRAIISMKGGAKEGGIERLQLDYSSPAVVRLKNSLGQETVYESAIVAGEYRLLSAMGAGCASCGETQVKYAYDLLGRLIEKQHFLPTGIPSERISYVRDALGRYTGWKKERYVSGKWQAPYDYRQFMYAKDAYHPTWILAPSRVQGKTHAWHYTYNQFDQLTEMFETGWHPTTTQEAAHPIERHWYYRYASINGHSVLVEAIAPSAPTLLVDWNTHGTFPQKYRWRAFNTKQDERVQSLTRDDLGRLIAVSDTWSGQTRQATVRYNDQGWLDALAISGQAPQRMHYDFLGRMIEVVGKARWQFDQADRLLQHTDDQGHQTTFFWDTESRLTAKQSQFKQSKVVQHYRYDEWGRMVEHQDALGGVHRQEMSADAMQAKMMDSLGREHQWLLSWGHEGRALLKSVEAVNTALSATTHIEQNRDGEIEKIVAPSGAATAFLYDDFGRVVQEQSADRGLRHYAYDMANRVTQMQSGRHRLSLSYDIWGRLLQKTPYLDQHIEKESGSVRHYQADRAVISENAVQRTQIVSDPINRFSTQAIQLRLTSDKAISWLMREDYDLNGRVIKQRLLDGSILRYERSASGELKAIDRLRVNSDWQGGLPPQSVLSKIDLASTGTLSYTLGNDVKVQRTPDQFGQLKTLSYTHAQNKGWTQDYQRDITGRITAIQPALHYTYDTLNHLSEVKHASASEAKVWRYHYDSAGRRVQAEEKSRSIESLYQPDTHRWLGTKTSTTTYDEQGQLIQSGDTHYSWNSLGQLIEVKRKGHSLARYAYNAEGARVLKIQDQGQDKVSYQLFVYSHGLLIGETTIERDHQAWQMKSLRQYVYVDGLLVMILENKHPQWDERSTDFLINEAEPSLWQNVSTWFRALWAGSQEHRFFVETDHLGTPKFVRDHHAHQRWQAEYEPFGDATIQHAPDFNLNIRFPGQYYDAETGLHYNYFRYYDPKRAEYLTPDPIGVMGGLNLYGYVGGDSVNAADPLGLIAPALIIPARMIGAGILGGAADAGIQYATTGRVDWWRVADAASEAMLLGLMPSSSAKIVTNQSKGVAQTCGSVRSAAYSGVREAAQLLKDAGVPRTYRKQILESFERETISVKTAGPNDFGIRYYDGINAQANGRYLFETFPATRESLALPLKWNMMTNFQQWQIAPGASFIEGRAASQGVYFSGGQMQKFILDTGNLLQ